MERRTVSRRDFLRWSLTAAGAAALGACTPKPAPTAATQATAATQPTPASGGKTTVRWMTRAGDWGGQEAVAAVPEQVKKYFNAQYPDIEVVIEPAAEDFIEKLVTAMVAGDAVDVFECWPNHFHEWVERDLLLDLQPYVDRDLTKEDVADYIEAQWEALFMNGKRVALPLYVDLRFETYNKDLFDKYGVPYPPADGNWTVDDYVATATKLTQDTNGDGEIDLWGTLIEDGGWFYWVRMWGGDWVDPNDNSKCGLASDECQAAFNFIWEQQWKKKPNVFAQPAQVENAWYYEAFVPQMIAMAEKGCYPALTVHEIGGKFRWDYAHVPKGPKGHRTLIDADGWSIWKGSKVVDAAWKLIKYLSGKEFQEEVLVKVVGVVPVRKSLLPGLFTTLRDKFPELKDVRLEVIREILEEPGYGGNVHWFKNHLKAMEIIDPAMELVFITGEKDPSYFKEICVQVDESQKD